MHLHAALVPPRDVQEDLAAAVASVRGGREQLSQVPAELLSIRLANFGKVSHADTDALRSTLHKELAQWPPMVFHFAGGVVLEPIGDDSAWAQLGGEADELVSVANLTVRVVKRLGFLVDRRLPRTLVRVGRITPATTEDYLQRLIDRLAGYSGPEWTCSDIALVRSSDTLVGPVPGFQVIDRLALEAERPAADERGQGLS